MYYEASGNSIRITGSTYYVATCYSRYCSRGAVGPKHGEWDQDGLVCTRRYVFLPAIYRYQTILCIYSLKVIWSRYLCLQFVTSIFNLGHHTISPRHKSRQKSFCMVRQYPVGISLDLRPSAEVKAGPESKGARIYSSKLVASTGTEQSKNFLEAIPQWYPASFCF